MLLGTYVPEIFESPLSAYSTLGPLCLVLFITMVKEGVEDYKRHRSDYLVNNRRCIVAQPDGSESTVAWKDLRVGMIIKVENKGEVPADVIVLQSSEPRAACYIETSNIDGETNLKLKDGVGAAANVASTFAEVGRLKGEIDYEGPNDRIHTFNGRLRVASGQWVPVGARNMVLRGCTLRNTKWILGLVVYTGRDTKVMKKSGGARSKMSQVEKTMNMCIKVIFASQFVLCTLATVALVLWNTEYSDQYPYLNSSSTVLYIPYWLGQWFTFLILFNNFIPISLYVTVEMVNYAQAWLVDQDAGMYDPVSDTPAKARTSNLNQDLGQIEYVFSDKTGTLTRNVMEFKQCSVAGVVYGEFTPEADADAEEHDKEIAQHEKDESKPSGCCAPRRTYRAPVIASGALPGPSIGASHNGAGVQLSPTLSSTPAKLENPFHKSAGPLPATSPASNGFEDPVLMSALRSSSAQGGYGGNWNPDVVIRAAANSNHARVSSDATIALEAFFTCMAVCHTVVPETDEKNPTGPAIYQAESPDEGALTKAARDIGFEFFQRHADHILFRRWSGEHSRVVRFDIHGVHEFNSTRKRMAVVCQNPDGKYFLMVKGADNVIFDRSHCEPYRALLERQLTDFASVGLRTLVLAQRELSQAEFQAWKRDYTEAAVALVDRDSKLAELAERYEQDLHVLGATAIEDRLQDGVPGTIKDLARAGIKTWVLTGDKVETAINIGFSCRLLDPSMEMIQIVAEDDATLRQQLSLLEQRFLPLVQQTQASNSFFSRLRRATPSRTLSMTTLPVPLTGNARATAGNIQSAQAPNPLQAMRAAPGSDRLQTDMAVVITGLALTHILGKKEMEQAFLTVARCCRAVIACRVSPQQKALIVRLVRKGISPAPMTLAIGDGANDVGMIQRAEVGVGISGKEGLQAVNSADFAIAQFRFLRRLLLVHGRWDYRRMTKVVLYSFYKNVVITLCLFYFTALTGFSGTSFYESNVYSSYNFVLGLPIIFAGIIDRDVSARTALDHPSVYEVGRKYADLNMKKILTWICWAILHSVLVFWLVYGIMGPTEGSWSSDGLNSGLSEAGLTHFNTLVWAMQFEVGMQTISWSWVNYFVLALSMGLFYIVLFGYSQLNTMSPEFYGVAARTFSSPTYWLMILLMFGAMIAFEYSAELVRRMHFFTSSDIAMERDRGFGTRNARGAIEWHDEADDKRAPLKLNSIIVTPASAQSAESGVRPVSPPQARADGKKLLSPGSMHAGVYHDYIDVPKESVMDGITPSVRERMGVADAHARTGYDYSYPTGKSNSPASPYASALESADAAISDV
jgi:magnesium-transporting ATPase (P-type)